MTKPDAIQVATEWRALAMASIPMNCDAFPDDDMDVPRFEVDPEAIKLLCDHILSAQPIAKEQSDVP